MRGKKVLAINSSNYGSTGNIMTNIVEKSGAKHMYAVASSRSNRKRKLECCIEIGNRFERNLGLLFSEYTGLNGFGSIIGTKLFLSKVNKFSPDIIHLHNCYVNLPILFRYIKRNNIPVVWTLHDCWAFTGQYPHFSLIKCDKWKFGCNNCPQYKQYPSSKIDRTKEMFHFKKKWFSGVENLNIVTPSEWLKKLVEESYLKEYPICVINNGIDLSVFKPTASEFRKEYNIGDKYIILGVASPWSEKKGLDVFCELAKSLNSERYKIVLVGVNEDIKNKIPNNILSIKPTSSQTELAKIYTAADVFANPTKEDNYPTVNMEALACGTPVVSFDTGGSSEMLNSYCGIVVPTNNLEKFKNAICCVCEEKLLTKEQCLRQAQKFDMYKRFDDYIELYGRIINGKN